MKGACHCGGVNITVPGRPDYLNECNCSVCYRLGATWGYFTPGAVAIAGETHAYRRVDRDDPKLAFHSCPRCGTTICWKALGDGAPDRMGVNMRLFDPVALKGIEVRYGDRRNHPTGPHYYRAPTLFDGAGVAP